MLHNFWFPQTVDAFRRKSPKQTPTCAMAHWGLAIQSADKISGGAPAIDAKSWLGTLDGPRR